jgi:hypothetical protein
VHRCRSGVAGGIKQEIWEKAVTDRDDNADRDGETSRKWHMEPL